MPKYTLDDVVSALRDSKIPDATIRQVVEDLNRAAAEEAADKEPAPKAKMGVVILLANPQSGFVLQLNADAPPGAALDRIRGAAQSFNRTRKGGRNPVRTFGEALEAIKGKHWKDEAHPEQKTRVLTRELTQVIQLPVDGRL